MTVRALNLVASSTLALALSLGTVPQSMAGGGDFVGGMIVGGVLGTILGANMDHKAPPPRRTVRRQVQDPNVTEYWRSVQQALNEVGINVGRPDGVAGRQTRAGVRAFQVSLNSDPTGTLTQLEYQELMRQASAAMAMGGGVVTGPQTAQAGWQMQPAMPPAGATMMAPVAMAPAYAAPQPVQGMLAQGIQAGQGQGMGQGIGTGLQPQAVPVQPDPVQPDAQVAALAPAAPAAAAAPGASAVADALLSPVKVLDDKALDGIEDATTILGVYLGDSRAAAEEAFTKNVGSCTTAGSLMDCQNSSDSYTDRASFATVKAESGESVVYLTRTLTFAQPVPKEAILAKLGETAKPLVDDPDMTLSSAPVCDRSMGTALGERTAAIEGYARDAAAGGAGMAKLLAECEAFFTAQVPLKDGQATGLTVTLFDGRDIVPAAAGTATAAPPADKQLPAGLKF